eukprot:Nk52_evm11s207 gene=Nk52_evmTU11s207
MFKKLGEGYGAPAPEELPLDIYYNKLTGWLLDRGKVPADWQAKALHIRGKINEALQDMPDVKEITDLLKGTYVNYFHCLRIVELLKESEKETKNIFGWYSSQRMKDWQEIVKLYQAENIFLAESAHMLAQNVNYEVPAVKRQIQRSTAHLKDLDRKESDYKANAAMHMAKYSSTCAELGIDAKAGTEIRSQLQGLVKELPEIFSNIVMAMQTSDSFKEAVKFYELFMQYTLVQGAVEDLKENKELSFSKALLEQGNISVHEFYTGEKEDEPIEFPIDDADTGGSVNWDSVDISGIGIEMESGVGGGSETSAAQPVIDWGVEEVPQGKKNDKPAISDDFGIKVAGLDERIDDNVQMASNNIQIDWGDDEVDSSNALDLIESDRKTILGFDSTRNKFMDELMEIQGFLEQRIDELGCATDMVSLNLFQNAEQDIQSQSINSLQPLKDAVDEILSLVLSGKTRQLLLIKTSPKYVDRFVDSLNNRLKCSQAMENNLKNVGLKRIELEETLTACQPKLSALVSKTKWLQQEVEIAMKTLLKRQVNIVGEINTLQ